MTIYTADGLVGGLWSRVVTIVGHRAARPGPARTQLDLARLGPSTVSCWAGPYHGAGTSTASSFFKKEDKKNKIRKKEPDGRN
jgi:hypothetical protein